MLRIPQRRFYGQSMQTMMGMLRMAVSQRNGVLDDQGWTGRRVLGYKLPDWQRDPCWTIEQSRIFIESVYVGANIGAFMVNSSFDPIGLDQILVDGQQRLMSLESYWADGFSIRGDDGNEWFWSDLTAQERAHMERIPFPWIETQYRDEGVLIEAYNRHNHSGTPHRPDQKADGGAGYRSVPPSTISC